MTSHLNMPWPMDLDTRDAGRLHYIGSVSTERACHTKSSASTNKHGTAVTHQTLWPNQQNLYIKYCHCSIFRSIYYSLLLLFGNFGLPRPPRSICNAWTQQVGRSKHSVSEKRAWVHGAHPMFYQCLDVMSLPERGRQNEKKSRLSRKLLRTMVAIHSSQG